MGSPQQQFRIAPSLRRCCWYVIVSGPVFIGLAYWTLTVLEDRDPTGSALVYSFFGILVLAMIPALRWRLWIVDGGLNHRRFFRWDFWSWDDFASGKIRKRYFCTLVDPDRSWWRNKLKLCGLSRSDFRQVIAEINKHYKLPPPPDVADTLTIRFGFRCSAMLDDAGIQLSRRDRPKQYTWSDVQQVQITRVDPLRHDFVNIVILLPDDEIALRLDSAQSRNGFLTWWGPSSEEINEYLLQRLPADKIVTSIDGELSKTREQLEREFKVAVKLKQSLPGILAVFFLILLGLFVLMAIDESLMDAIIISGVGALLLLPLAVAVFYMQNKRVKYLQQELAKMKGGSSKHDGK